MPALLFHYFKTLLYFNLPFSVFVGAVAGTLHENYLLGLVSSFNLTLLTGGFVLALYFYEQRYKQEYYFFYNKGITRTSLIVAAFAFHLLLAAVLYTLIRIWYA